MADPAQARRALAAYDPAWAAACERAAPRLLLLLEGRRLLDPVRLGALLPRRRQAPEELYPLVRQLGVSERDEEIC